MNPQTEGGILTTVETETAIVVSTFSREMLLELKSGEQVRARIRGKKLKPVCADRVIAEPLVNEPEWIITSIEPRRNELTRPDSRGRTEILAANFDCLCVVAASAPDADWFIVDRYLCAAELLGVEAVVVYNKTDMGTLTPATCESLSVYESLGYPVLKTSVHDSGSVQQLAATLAGRTSIIVGQSGVGKSSLINMMSDVSRQKTAEISAATREGRHTTVNSSLIPLQNGGRVIDSPGVRDYAPVIDGFEQAATGFREIRDAAQDCRFANCRHRHEPGCAVKSRVESGDLDRRRYDSLQRLVVSSEQLQRDY